MSKKRTLKHLEDIERQDQKRNVGHTPGPWNIVNHNWSDTSIYAGASEDEDSICRLSLNEELVTEENQEEHESQQEANARLIAAAPELLYMLQLMVEKYGHIGGSKEVIAKATGT